MQVLDADKIGDRKRQVAAIEKIAAHMKRIVLFLENMPIAGTTDDDD